MDEHDHYADHGAMGNDTAMPTTWCTGATPMQAGFTASPAGHACLLWLFRDWVLDDPTKYAFATLGTAALAFCVEALGAARRRWLSRATSRAAGALYALAYALQVLVAYICMLLAMTFSVWLVLAVVFGLTAGHMTFRRGAVDPSSPGAVRYDPDVEGEGLGMSACHPPIAPAKQDQSVILV